MGTFLLVEPTAAQIAPVRVAPKQAKEPIQSPVRSLNAVGVTIWAKKRLDLCDHVFGRAHRDGNLRISRPPLSSGVDRVEDSRVGTASREGNGFTAGNGVSTR